MSSITNEDEVLLMQVIQTWPIEIALTGAQWQRAAFGGKLRYPQWAVLSYEPSDGFFINGRIRLLICGTNVDNCHPPPSGQYRYKNKCVFYYYQRPLEMCHTKNELYMHIKFSKPGLQINDDIVYKCQQANVGHVFQELIKTRMICFLFIPKSGPDTIDSVVYQLIPSPIFLMPGNTSYIRDTSTVEFV